LLIALIIGADSYEAWQDYRSTVEQSERTQIALSRAIAEQTARMVQEIDVVLSDYSDWRGTAEGMTADQQSVREHLRADVERFPFMHSIAIMDARGQVFTSAQHDAQAKPDSGDPGFFNALARSGHDDLYIGRPFLSDRYLTFAVGRKIRDRSGAFAGAVVARVAFEYLTAFYSTISVSRDASIRLVREDSAVLAQYPANAAAISDDAYVRRAFRGSKNNKNHVELAYRDAQLEGQKQLVTLRKVENYPMVIETAQPMSSVLLSWRQQETSSAARTLTLSMLAGLLLMAFRTALQRHDRLEQERRRLEREIKDAQKADALGFLAASMAHDFNNVLGAIVGHGEITRMLVEDNPQAVASTDRLLAASERARQLVGRVLAFDPNRSVAHVPLAIEPVVTEVLELIRAALPPSIALHADDFGPHGSILGDATEVHQVVMNLCSNAVRAMPGGGRLEVKIEALEVDQSRDMTLGRLTAGHWLRLSISDTGIGLAADRVTSIFEPFYTTQPAGQGTGIGLTVVRNIVKRMGGAIEVDSRPGSGTRMSVYWPLLENTTVAARADLQTPGRGQAVLIVDDEPELVRLAEETVASLGYEAIGFADARAALKAFEHSPARFDAVLTDERMPALRGIALAKAIHDLRSEVPIILVTGCREATTDLLAKQAGVTEILEKPLRARNLQAALARAFSSAA
jgi:signal transduction histidine kinase/ActR/RegA family two-component response regulator